MSGPELNTDLVAVACVVEASHLLASEWSRVLIDYVYPLLKRLYELHPSHQFRIAFVTYGAADTRPSPILSKKYFAPLSKVTKELREEPSRLGIGQTNSGSGRGLSALEGFVAAIELFDVLMASANFNHSQSQSPQKDNRSLVSHLLHIAASPPDNAQRPQCNTLQHLDFVNWDSIPAELRKRKINSSLISLRKIPQFQDLQSSVAGPGAQSPWFNVHTPHILLLAGFPTPQKTGAKRQTDVIPPDQSPDAKRQKVVTDTVSKPSSASPALAPARISQNQRSQQTVSSSQASQPPSAQISAPVSTPAQSAHATPPVPVPVPTPAIASPAPAPSLAPSLGQAFKNEVWEQVVPPTGLKFGQMMERFKTLETEISSLDSQITEAQNTGQTEALIALKNEKDRKDHIEKQIKLLLKQHYHNAMLAKELQNAPVRTAGSVPNGSAEAGPSTQSHPPNVSVASSQPVDEHKGISDSQMVAQFWQSRGGTISASSTPQAGPGQTQSHATMTPEAAAQIQKLVETKGIQPQSFGSSSHPSGITSQQTGVNPNVTSSQVTQSPTNMWVGTLSGTFPKPGGQVTNEVQVHVVGIFTVQTPAEVHKEIRTETWPRNLTLNICKEPVKDPAELPSWLKRHQSRAGLMRFTPNPRVPDAAINNQRFQRLTKFMTEHGICAYTGWPLPSGKVSRTIFIFAMGQGWLAGTVFPNGIPDLPGSGNVLDAQPLIEQAKPPSTNGIPLPAALLARMQGLEPAKQKQILAQIIRQQQLEQLRRQQLQQTQQSHNTQGQALNSLGMTIPQNPYTAVANIPIGLHANVNPPMNAGAYNAGGTVNHEMMQSFMQRNVEGTPSQGMNAGGMNSGQMP